MHCAAFEFLKLDKKEKRLFVASQLTAWRNEFLHLSRRRLPHNLQYRWLGRRAQQQKQQVEMQIKQQVQELQVVLKVEAQSRMDLARTSSTSCNLAMAQDQQSKVPEVFFGEEEAKAGMGLAWSYLHSSGYDSEQVY
eukprot:Skav200586  [mRNA]  locus=scaffold1051:153768:161732:- [translate_table: standard]